MEVRKAKTKTDWYEQKQTDDMYTNLENRQFRIVDDDLYGQFREDLVNKQDFEWGFEVCNDNECLFGEPNQPFSTRNKDVWMGFYDAVEKKTGANLAMYDPTVWTPAITRAQAEKLRKEDREIMDYYIEQEELTKLIGRAETPLQYRRYPDHFYRRPEDRFRKDDVNYDIWYDSLGVSTVSKALTAGRPQNQPFAIDSPFLELIHMVNNCDDDECLRTIDDQVKDAYAHSPSKFEKKEIKKMEKLIEAKRKKLRGNARYDRFDLVEYNKNLNETISLGKEMNFSDDEDIHQFLYYLDTSMPNKLAWPYSTVVDADLKPDKVVETFKEVLEANQYEILNNFFRETRGVGFDLYKFGDLKKAHKLMSEEIEKKRNPKKYKIPKGKIIDTNHANILRTPINNKYQRQRKANYKWGKGFLHQFTLGRHNDIIVGVFENLVEIHIIGQFDLTVIPQLDNYLSREKGTLFVDENGLKKIKINEIRSKIKEYRPYTIFVFKPSKAKGSGLYNVIMKTQAFHNRRAGKKYTVKKFY